MPCQEQMFYGRIREILALTVFLQSDVDFLHRSCYVLSRMESVPYQLGLLPMAHTTSQALRKPVKAPPLVITPVYDKLLRDLNILQRATAQQLCRLNYKMGMLTTVKARLKDLTEAGFVLPLFHPLIKLPYVYCLSRKGLQYLDGLGIDVRDYFRPSEEKETERNFLFREHMLAISDVLIHALLFERSEPAYRLEHMSHERFFKNHPVKATYTRNNKQEHKTLVPQEFSLTHEPTWLADLFLFTALPERIEEIEPRQLFLDPVWYAPGDDTNPVSLLGE